MIELFSDPQVWASLLTLTLLEIVLGIDNIIFISIVTAKLPEAQQASARRTGLLMALAMRIMLLFSISWIISLEEPIVTVFGLALSWRDFVLLAGGVFLLYKGTKEVHEMTEGAHEEESSAVSLTFAGAVIQILLLDAVFSIDSVITAVGMAEHLEVMIAAVCISIGVMLLAAEPVAGFVNRHPTVKMLALAFLLLIGVALIADGLHFHIPRGYIYAAIAFSILVEVLNQMASRARKKGAKKPGSLAGQALRGKQRRMTSPTRTYNT